MEGSFIYGNFSSREESKGYLLRRAWEPLSVSGDFGACFGRDQIIDGSPKKVILEPFEEEPWYTFDKYRDVSYQNSTTTLLDGERVCFEKRDEQSNLCQLIGIHSRFNGGKGLSYDRFMKVLSNSENYGESNKPIWMLISEMVDSNLVSISEKRLFIPNAK